MTEMIPIKRGSVGRGIRTRANLDGSMVSGLTKAKSTLSDQMRWVSNLLARPAYPVTQMNFLRISPSIALLPDSSDGPSQ